MPDSNTPCGLGAADPNHPLNPDGPRRQKTGEPKRYPVLSGRWANMHRLLNSNDPAEVQRGMELQDELKDKYR